jgi:hypothetical protein
MTDSPGFHGRGSSLDETMRGRDYYDMTDPNNRARIAYHEAGHVALAWIHGEVPDWVTIVSTPEYCGRMLGRFFHNVPSIDLRTADPPQRRMARQGGEALLHVLLAGHLAQSVWGGNADDHESDPLGLDWEPGDTDVLRARAVIVGAWEMRHGRRLEADGEAIIDREMVRAQRRALLVLEDAAVWRVVRWVARGLEERGTLTRDELYAYLLPDGRQRALAPARALMTGLLP